MDENEEALKLLDSLSPDARAFFAGAGISVVERKLSAHPELLDAINPLIKDDVIRACAWAKTVRKDYEDFTKSFNN